MNKSIAAYSSSGTALEREENKDERWKEEERALAGCKERETLF